MRVWGASLCTLTRWGLADVAHVAGCRLIKESRVQFPLDNVAGNICQALTSGWVYNTAVGFGGDNAEVNADVLGLAPTCLPAKAWKSVKVATLEPQYSSAGGRVCQVLGVNVIKRLFNPRFLSLTASYDVASNVCHALGGGGTELHPGLNVPNVRIDAVYGLDDDEPVMAQALRQLAALATDAEGKAAVQDDDEPVMAQALRPRSPRRRRSRIPLQRLRCRRRSRGLDPSAGCSG